MNKAVLVNLEVLVFVVLKSHYLLSSYLFKRGVFLSFSFCDDLSSRRLERAQSTYVYVYTHKGELLTRDIDFIGEKSLDLFRYMRKLMQNRNIPYQVKKQN